MALKLKFELPDKLFLKDPQDSKYGHKLLTNAVELLDALGFEKFTFKKLGVKMESSEVSIYRYFENKHLLLLYLNCWYLEWVAYMIGIQTMNVKDSEEQLKIAIHCMVHASKESELTDYINESVLFQVIMKESSKTYHVSSVDQENKHGLYLPYKELVRKVAGIINRINPDFNYSNSLAITLFEMINNQSFYAQHLPTLTSLGKKNTMKQLETMVNHFAFASINYSQC